MWWRFDDAVVFQVTEEDVLKEKACMLFYERSPGIYLIWVSDETRI